jgi:hypothetical protein
MRFDCDITASEIQQLAGADAVAAFFAKLGYRTDVRVPQTPGNLGIAADGTVRPIKRVELIADQEGLLQVYLFELASVTVTHTRALARAFRNRAGNYLLVLTSDYDRLDFVLVEKYLPTPAAAPTTIGQAQVGVRPRMLTVERRKPGRVELRVIRRFTYTESDPLAQYDKMLSAYAIADWSEEFFNNRALFSDYYLLERLRDRPEWAEDPKPAYAALQELYRGASSRLANQPEERVRADLLEPVFKTLGFAAKTGKKSASAAAEPDYRLMPPDGKGQPLALCLAYPWGRSLDGKDPERDKETPEENPGAVVVSALEKGEAQWAAVTNGKLWRLYSARAHSRATNYYEIDLEEALSPAGPQGGSPAESFRYFWLLFRRQALEPATVSREGREQSLSFLDLLLAESEDYAKELGERLKERVFKQVFPHLAEGFIASIRKRDGKDADLSQAALDEVFQGTLTLLYRLLFLLYAESRNLLPAKEVRGYFEASITKLKREMADAAGTIADKVEGTLRKAYRDDSYALYDRLAHLFAVVDQGDPALNVPVYNGGLFLTQPQAGDDSPEARAARFLAATKVSDRNLACALNHLVRDEDPKRHDLVFIDFKSLGVRQLGSIYEGLLEFKVRIAPHKLAVTKEKGREVYVPFADLDEREQARAERTGNVVKKGEAYLENDNHERKATGSYYTPDPIVKYIVEHTVGPVLEEKFEAVRPLLRQAQQERAAFFKQQEAFRKQGMRPKPDAQADLVGREVVDKLFDLKVLDPAMGSGHFLVEAVDFITDRTLTFLAAFPWNPVLAHLGRMRETILAEMDEQGIAIDPKRLTDVNLLKRHVLKRCTYGVDLNPMAVELAKVSLWLDCFTLGAPLSFLDHHLRCGNSLIGVTVEEVRAAIEGGESMLWGSRFAGLMLATDLMRHVGELSDVTSAQVRESRSQYAKAQDALAPFRRILDVYASRWFGNEPQKAGKRGGAAFDPALEFLRSPEVEGWINNPAATKGLTDWDKKVVARTLAAADDKRFFHWELEFPEVFYGPTAGSKQKIDRLADAGFDAIVGNPPYVRQETLKVDKAFFEAAYRNTYDATCDLYVYFMEREIELLRPDGLMGMIVANKWLRAGYGRKLRDYLLRHARPESIVDFGHSPIFPDADTFPCVPVFSRRPAPLPAMSSLPEGEVVRTCQFPRDDYDPIQPIGPYVMARRQEVPTRLLDDEAWSLEDPRVQMLLAKLRANGLPLKGVLDAPPSRGTVTGLNDAFFIDRETKERLTAQDGRSADIIKPLSRGRDVDRWRPRVSDMYMIVARRGVRIDQYPAIRQHLAQFRKRLEPRPADWNTSKDGRWPGRAAGEYKWYELQASPSDEYIAVVESPKIVYQEIQFHSWFALDKSGAYPNNKVFMLPSEDLALLAVLNSPLMWWVLTRTLPHMKDEALTPSGFIMENLRVCLPTDGLREKVIGRAQRLGQLTAELHDWENHALAVLRDTAGVEGVDRRCLLWFRRSDGEFVRMVQGIAVRRLAPAAETKLKDFHQKAGEDFSHLLAEQLKLEKEVAFLVEDAYGLTPEERALLRATRPVRDPIDVLEKRLAGVGGAEPETAGEE